MKDIERPVHRRIKKGWSIGGYINGGASEDKERLGHWRIKKGWGIRG